MNGIDEILFKQRVVICVGSGGVGKTTIAAALGVRARQLNRRALVLTVDPAKRLARALGLTLGDVDERKVPSGTSAGELYAAIIDSQKIFNTFIAEHAGESSLVERILNNPLYQQLSTTLSGSQEFTSMERLLQGLEKNHDIVILDTPPTKHALDFLVAPERLNALFQDAVFRWIAGGSESSGFFSQLFSRGTKTVRKSLEVVTGQQFIEQLVDFFAAIRALQSVLQSRTDKIRAILKSNECRFVLVTSFDEAKLSEAGHLRSDLEKLGYQLSGVVINRAYPELVKLDDPTAVTDTPQLAAAFKQFASYYRHRYTLFQAFSEALPTNIQVVRVPEYAKDITGVQSLEELANWIGES